MLDTKNAVLIPLEASHAEDLIQFVADEDLWKWWLREPPKNRKSLSKEIQTALDEREMGLRTPYAIYAKEAEKYIGSTSYFFRNAHEVEIGSTWIAKPYHGTGLNQELKKRMLEHAFRNLNAKKVILQTDSLNLRSQKAITKIGAKQVEIRPRDKVVWDGRIRDSVIFEITPTSFKNGPLSCLD